MPGNNPNLKWYILIGLGTITLAVLVVILVIVLSNKTEPTVLAQCSYDGTTYDSGTSFGSIDGCNTCSCSNGSVFCTEMACLTTPTATATPTVTTGTVTSTVSPTPSTFTTPIPGVLRIFFGKPTSETDYTTLAYVDRPTDAVGLGQVSIVLNSVLSGPTAPERALGYNAVLTLSGDSTCGGKSYQFSLSGTALTVRFCKNIAYVANTGSGGAYAGMGLAANARVIQALTQSLQINGITTVIIKQSDNTCFAKDTGLNVSCVD